MGAYEPVPNRAKLKHGDTCVNCGNKTDRDAAFYDATGGNVCRDCFWDGNDNKLTVPRTSSPRKKGSK